MPCCLSQVTVYDKSTSRRASPPSDQAESLLPTLALQLPAGRAHSARGKSDRSATWTGGAAAAAGGQQTGIRVRGEYTQPRPAASYPDSFTLFLSFHVPLSGAKGGAFCSLLSLSLLALGAITLKSEYTQMYGSFNLIHRRDVRVQTPATRSLHERRRKETGGGRAQNPSSLLSNGPHRKRYVEQSFFLAAAIDDLQPVRASRAPRPSPRTPLRATYCFFFVSSHSSPSHLHSDSTQHTAPATRSKKKLMSGPTGLRARTQTHHIHAFRSLTPCTEEGSGGKHARPRLADGAQHSDP